MRITENIIRSVDRSSPLFGRVAAGDRLIAINGNSILDVLDYKYYSYDPVLTVLIQKADGRELRLSVEKAEGGDLGLDFETYLMDKPRSCANHCVFCFIDQLPRGMRRTMYFKDDDARLSFLMGNYITLTNLSPREIQRVMDLHISPVNVSVHTTNPELRTRMLRNARAGECMDILRRWGEAGIVMNCQIVCCPGWNDGEELSRSMRELAALYPAVHSVSVVPVGLTRFREGLTELTPFTPSHAAETLELVERFAEECLEKYGSRIFFCGDELYIKAGRELPDDEFYEEHTQLENGVGMMRLLETEFLSALHLSDGEDGVPFSIACGVGVGDFFTALLEKAKARYPRLNGRVYPIENDFFGHSITVSGLVTGQDLIAQLRGKELGQRLFISQNMLRRAEVDFLDGVTLEQAAAELGLPVYPVEQDGFALWDAISGECLPEVSVPRPEAGDAPYYIYNKLK